MRAVLIGVVVGLWARDLPAAQPPDLESRHHATPLQVPPSTRIGFTLTSAEDTGVRFTNQLAAARSLTNHVLLNGSGVAAGDVDGDGRCDLYFCGLDGPNALYRNLGDWTFADITEAAGVACTGLDSTGAVLADVDGDSDLDLLVTSVGSGVHLFLNDGRAKFRDFTRSAGLASGAASMSMTLDDMDGDGDLDLYVANYRTYTMRDTFSMRITVKTVDGRPVITHVNGRPVSESDLAGRFSIDAEGRLLENGEADHLYRNDGGGRFTLLPQTGGRFLDAEGRPLEQPLFDWGLTAMFRDLNQDGAPDLYVCNDLGSPDRIWLNNGQGIFRPLPPLALRKTSWFSMGLDFADLNGDGLEEFLVTDMVSRDHRLRQVQVSDHQLVYARVGEIDNRPRAPRNTLFLNWGDGDYAELAYYAGVEATEWSWAPLFLDVDLDGYEDLLVATGFERDVQDLDIARQLEAIRQAQRLDDASALQMRQQFPRLDLPNLAFRNEGDLTFADASRRWGFDTVGISQGMALADLDDDGDQDVILNNLNAVAGLYRNDAAAPRIAVRVKGQAPNTQGIGAQLVVVGGGLPRQGQAVISGGRYLSSDEGRRTFAAGNTTNTLQLTVRWRSGKTHSVTARANHLYTLDEAAAPSQPPTAAPPETRSLFADASHRLDHRHVDTEFDDFVRQPLLPKKFSQLGPGVAWFDVDNDGADDLAIGTGQGGMLSLWRNDRQGGFERFARADDLQPSRRDQTAVVGWRQSPEKAVFLAGWANYEDALVSEGTVVEFDPAQGTLRETIPGQVSSAGPILLADLDADGDLDLFVGGRLVGGRYPEPAASQIYRNHRGEWTRDDAAAAAFARVGLVSGAVASDWNGDGFPELILATEWGPVSLWINDRGRRFLNATAEFGLDRYRGWWNGVNTGDFDGDGRMDIVASNWGMNSKYERHREMPLRLYYGDFNGEGGVDLLEAHYDATLKAIVPWMHWGRVAPALPFIERRFRSYRAFAEASVAEILGDRLTAANVLQANWLSTTLFLNRGDHVEARPLPFEAQLSPAFAVTVADADGDGAEDVFLSQNFFATEPETGRYDAGRGLWLKGDGRGGLVPLSAQESGIRVYGEQRGAAVADYDGDGRVDLVVTQNGAATRLFRNVGATPGLRIRLQGPRDNPAGIGSSLRLGRPGEWGPAREIHAGSGYWSQDSSVVVMQRPSDPCQVWVRWPGGSSTTNRIPAGAREVRVDLTGNLEVLRHHED